MEFESTPSSNPTQISHMFQKIAFAFKSKTFESFNDQEQHDSENEDGFAEDFITDQKVIIIKPDLNTKIQSQTTSQSKSQTQSHTQSQNQIQNQDFSDSIIQPFDTQLGNHLISSVFALISSFEASYLQLQTSHVPFDEKGIMINDEVLINHLLKLNNLRGLYIDSRTNPGFNPDFTTGSCFEAQVNENQNKLRALETMFNRLQFEIDGKDDKVLMLRKQLGEIEDCNSKLSLKLGKFEKSPIWVLPKIRAFCSLLRDVCRFSHRFTKALIKLMKKAGYDLELAASYVHPDVVYVKKGHIRYAFLSYVCLSMFQCFDSESFGVAGIETYDAYDNSVELFNYESFIALETLNKDPNLPFSRFCERKYEELVHPTMESSIFNNLDRKEIMESWRSIRVFYDAFVEMSSAIWLLHKLACSFTPPAVIFQVEKGVDFSMVYMEDVRKKDAMHEHGVLKVWFTVIPGFKIGRTVVQSQVYLTGS